MRIAGSAVTLVAMLAFFLCGNSGDVLAMGAHGGPPSSQGDEKAGEAQTDADGKNVDKAVGSSEKEKAEQPPPSKAPRIKYRDIYECGC